MSAQITTSDWPKVAVYLLKSQAKALINVWQFLKVGALRATGAIDYPVPPNSKMRSTSSSSIRHYYESGIRTAMPIMSAAAAAGMDLKKPLAVLDFGCGVARQIVQVQRDFPHFKISACDVNDGAIAYIKETFPKVSAYTNNFKPPLAYGAESFDLIYSVSIFSHLTLEDQGKWLEELSRVTRVGGVCCLTVMGAHSIGRWAGLDESGRRVALDSLSTKGSYYMGSAKPAYMVAAERIMRMGSNLIGIDEDYGDTFYSETYIRNHWAVHGLEVVFWIPGIIDNLQDLVVLKRVR